MDIDKLIFLDESGLNTGMTRLYVRSFDKERVVDYISDVRFERTTILSSIRANGDMVPLIFEGALNGELFKVLLRRNLCFIGQPRGSRDISFHVTSRFLWAGCWRSC